MRKSTPQAFFFSPDRVRQQSSCTQCSKVTLLLKIPDLREFSATPDLY
jgi:hypothetical protein